MVDVKPWKGDYAGTVVRDNIIIGGSPTATDSTNQTEGVIIKSVISRRECRHF